MDFLDTDRILEGLTAAQREAVQHIDGPMLVVAGAGSGKTRVVTHRIAWLMAHDVAPQHILTMTFTNKAAEEMKNRVAMMTGVAPQWMGTFHSVCAQLLRRWLDDYPEEPRNGRFTIYDTDDQKKVIKNLFKVYEVNEKKGDLSVSAVLSAISACKGAGSAVSDKHYDSKHGELLAKICQDYERTLRESNALDFDDLLWVTVRMLHDCPEILARCQGHFRYIMVDEYQDTNHVQYVLLRLLAGERANLHVTGDPDQSIYSWRGALYRNIMEFTEDYPSARTVFLEQNYRSTGYILKAANALIEHNLDRMEKRLFTEGGLGDPITLGSFMGDREEAEWVARQINKHCGAGANFADFAIFYRTNAQSRAIEDALVKGRIPYQIIGGIRFYERKEIRDFIAYLRLMATPDDRLAFERVMESRSFGVGKASLEKLYVFAFERRMNVVEYLQSEWLKKDWPKVSARVTELGQWLSEFMALRSEYDELGALAEAALKQSGLIAHYRAELQKERATGNRKKGDMYPSEERLQNLESFIGKAKEFVVEVPENGLDEFLAEVALNSSTDEMVSFQEKVTLMTLHCSKGLEFPFVFITGLEQGLLPHINSISGGSRDVEEERRLLYVGITRAEKKLYLSMAWSRYNFGSVKQSTPSCFLKELPRDCLKRVDEGSAYAGSSSYNRFAPRFGGNSSRYSSSGSGYRPVSNQQWLQERRRGNRRDNYYDYDSED